MKQTLLTTALLITTVLAFAQAPQGINYQAVVRDAGGDELVSQAVSLRMTILENNTTTVYQETHSTTTNDFGLVNLVIGQGTVNQGVFADIDWSAGSYFAQTEVDVSGSTNYALMGSQQLMSVPYALYAETSGGSASNTLDGAYDEGGAGLGRVIDATDGAVAITGEDGIMVSGTFDNGLAVGATGGIAEGAGTRMFFNPNKAAFRAGYVDGTQWDNANIGNFSTAIGHNTEASGFASTAMGFGTIASGGSSTAMGTGTMALANSLATGQGTIASGGSSTAMGGGSIASGNLSVAMGEETEASGTNSLATGGYTEASGYNSTALGGFTIASGLYSIAMGNGAIASGQYSTAMGVSTNASGHRSTAMGNLTIASGLYSTAMGDGVDATGIGELYNSGNVKGLSFISTSDKRVKQNIAPFSGALSKVMLLSPKTYFYNTEAFPRFEAEKDKPQIGFIAQEVELIFPEMVATDGDEVGLKGVRYGQLTAVLVQAIKEMQQDYQSQIDELQKEINKLKTSK
jgi:hypothetical protein